MKKQVIILSVLILLLLGIIIISPSIIKKENSGVQISPTIIVVSEANKKFTHKGKEGIDALSLLREETTIKQDNSGLVISINGREADSLNREYWSFYVNGKMASVGPADYITKDADFIEWKIETY